jgi:hypothetical protein
MLCLALTKARQRRGRADENTEQDFLGNLEALYLLVIESLSSTDIEQTLARLILSGGFGNSSCHNPYPQISAQ